MDGEGVSQQQNLKPGSGREQVIQIPLYPNRAPRVGTPLRIWLKRE